MVRVSWSPSFRPRLRRNARRGDHFAPALHPSTLDDHAGMGLGIPAKELTHDVLVVLDEADVDPGVGGHVDRAGQGAQQRLRCGIVMRARRLAEPGLTHVDVGLGSRLRHVPVHRHRRGQAGPNVTAVTPITTAASVMTVRPGPGEGQAQAEGDRARQPERRSATAGLAGGPRVPCGALPALMARAAESRCARRAGIERGQQAYRQGHAERGGDVRPGADRRAHVPAVPSWAPCEDLGAAGAATPTPPRGRTDGRTPKPWRGRTPSPGRPRRPDSA